MIDKYIPGCVVWRGFYVHKDNIPLHKPGAYLFTQFSTGRSYIGISSVSVKTRGISHSYSKGNWRFPRAIRKYGRSAFLFTPLVYVIGPVSIRWLQELEACLIKEYDAINHGFNVKATEGPIGPRGPEFSKVLRKAWKNPRVRKAHQVRIRKMLQDPEIRRRRVEGINTPEVKAKRGVSQTKSWQNLDIRARRCKGFRIAWEKPTVRAKHLQYFQDPEWRSRWMESNTASNARPEVKAARSRASIEISSRPEIKLDVSLRTKGGRWIYCGDKVRRLRAGEALPNGWNYGRGGRQLTTKGFSWINDGISRRMIREGDPVPSGWCFGVGKRAQPSQKYG